MDCEDAAIKGKMESVLNQGENGKHLWQQINWFSEQDGAHSTQISNKLTKLGLIERCTDTQVINCMS